MKVISREDFLVLVAVVGDALARCGSTAPSALVYLEVSDASRVHARVAFSREESGAVLVFVEVI